MKAAVTGGTGFLGQAIVRQLVPICDEVRVLTRRPEAAAEVRAQGAVPITGDVTRRGGCEGLVEPGDVIFHAAAQVDLRAHWRQFYQTTVEGTRELLRAALPRRPGRFVYVGTGAVYPPSVEKGPPVCADRVPAKPAPYNRYARAKIMAEQIVRRWCDRVGCPWTILRLTFVYGPGNREYLRQCARIGRRGNLMIIGPGNNLISTLYVDDGARACILAGTHPAAVGRVYDVANEESVPQEVFIGATAEALGFARPVRHIPYPVAFTGSLLAEAISGMLGREPRICRAAIKLMAANQRVDTSPIREELGWKPEIDFEEGIRKTRQWCQANMHLLGETC